MLYCVQEYLVIGCLPPKGGDANVKERFSNPIFNHYHHSTYSIII